MTENGSNRKPASNGKALVIVESPAKARTIAGFLPKGFVVEASVGHVRDLPNSAKEIPAEIKDKEWARLGIDVDNDFQPVYVIPAEKKKQIAKLRSLLKDASELYLATDEDREGESISWHLVQVLKPKVPLRRLVFHEITKKAIAGALESPRELDENLVRAQETRRILDRLYGYEISPILWRKVGPGLSAGRVQSVAIRIIVEREEERKRFKKSNYWDLQASFDTPRGGNFAATLISYDSQRVAIGKDFDAATGELIQKEGSGILHLTEERAGELLERVKQSSFSVSSLEKKPYTSRPSAPFTTSTLQQEANRKLRLSARRAMQAAQRLYENGLITYMRTDSTMLSEQALELSRNTITDLFGKEYLSPEPRQYKTKVKNAQEAHEAIRPAGEFQHPDELKKRLQGEDLKVYELIWKRTVACQMADARGHRTTLQASDGHAVFQTSGKTIEFPGYLRAYVEGADDPSAELADKETVLPQVEQGDALKLDEIEPRSHTTQPPARYTEASLVKELEARGIGRPSTYASIIDTILRREYVTHAGNALVPSFTAFAVVKLMKMYFEDLVDVEFTARMEDDLDEISLGDKEQVPYLRRFYFGEGKTEGLKQRIAVEIDPRESRTLVLGKDEAGEVVEVRIGRYGPYLEHGEDRASIPIDMAPDELTVERALELLALDSGPAELGEEEGTGKKVYAKTGRFGPYVQLGENDDEPKMKSLFPDMVLEEITLEQAMKLLSLPRIVGVDTETQEEIQADYGRYGPYVRRGKETRSLQKPEDVFEVTVEQAMELVRQEKRRGRQTAEVLREIGPHPETKVDLKIMKGRYGPYVTDGEVNASLPKGADPDETTIEQAIELLRARLERMGSKPKKKKAKRKAKKKAGKKKVTKKKATKKKTSRKTTPAP